MTETTLDVSLRHTFGDFALDLAFTAGNGVTGIIGPSGAGKTTLLQTIAGLFRPRRGRIALGGEVFLDTDAGIFIPPEARRIGYVFQEARLFPHLSVAQNLDYGARRRTTAAAGVSRGEVVDLLGLAPLLGRLPHRLSGGEAQRVAIGRALLSAPRLILMDEPLSSLDMRRRREILPYLDALHRRLDLPILYVSHNIDEIVRLADMVVAIGNGHVAAAGAVAEVLNRHEIQSMVLGEEARAADPASIVEARIIGYDPAHRLTEVEFSGAMLALPHLDLPAGASVRLRIHARDVAIATEPPRGLSIQNVIEARISALRPAGEAQVDVDLAVGPEARQVKLASRITARAAEQLQLAPGRAVWALVKTVVLASGMADVETG